MGKLIDVTWYTKHKVPIDGVAEGMKQHCVEAVVIGETETGGLYYASTTGDKAAILWMIEFFKAHLLAGDLDGD